MRACLAVLALVACGAALPAQAAPAVDCTAQVVALDKDREDLPRLEFASPADRPPYCITLETNMAFAARVKAHVAQCPTSAYAEKLAEWEETRTAYGKLFVEHRCKRTL